MTDIPDSCQSFFDLIEQGRGRTITEIDKLIACLSRKISDNAGQKRAGKRSERKAREIVSKLKTGEVVKFNPNLAFLGKEDPLDVTDEEWSNFQRDMISMNWQQIETNEEKMAMKCEHDMCEASDDEFVEYLQSQIE